jgi:hypothetical protein
MVIAVVRRVFNLSAGFNLDENFYTSVCCAELARLMKIENLIRYAPRAVGRKPSARQGEARLRGQERNNYSENTPLGSIMNANPGCAGESGVITRQYFGKLQFSQRSNTLPEVCASCDAVDANDSRYC